MAAKKRSDGYFMAKREMVEAIDRRIQIIDEKRQKAVLEGNHDLFTQTNVSIQTLEEVRNFVRNVMLWDIRND